MPTIRTYDANGNLTYDGRQDLEIRWNVLNLVSGAETHDDGSLTFSRLSDGTLVARQAVSGGSTAGKRYCGSFVFTTGTGITTPQVESVAWDEGRVFRDSSTGAYRDCWFAGDHLGNVRSVVDISQSLTAPVVLEQNDYLPFGTKVSNSQHAQMGTNRWRYAGKEEFLDLNLLEFGARMYNPFTARWTAVDPMAGKYAGMSSFGYCAGNPANMVDPDGTDWLFQNESQHYIWYDNVSSANDTPEGYEYVGWRDIDILRHMGFSQLVQHQDMDIIGQFATDDNLQPFSYIHYSVTVSLSPTIVYLERESSTNNVQGRVFSGLTVSIATASNVASLENTDFSSQVSISGKNIWEEQHLQGTTRPYIIVPGTEIKDAEMHIPCIIPFSVSVSTAWYSNTGAGRVPMGILGTKGVIPYPLKRTVFRFN